MNRATSAAVLVTGILLTGCAGSPLTPRERATLGGAVLGAGTGAIIGGAVGKPGPGALIGAGIGTVAGAVVGDAIQGAQPPPVPVPPPPPVGWPGMPAPVYGPVQVYGAGDPTRGAVVNRTPWRVSVEVDSTAFVLQPGEARMALLDVGPHRVRARAEVNTHFGPRVVGHVDRTLTVDPRRAGWSLHLTKWDFR